VARDIAEKICRGRPRMDYIRKIMKDVKTRE
jgi:hypothetical protein